MPARLLPSLLYTCTFGLPLGIIISVLSHSVDQFRGVYVRDHSPPGRVKWIAPRLVS